MIQSTATVDWRWAHASNMRILNLCGDSPIWDDPAWDTFQVSLLPKVPAPARFKMLRQVAILEANAKLWSKCCFHFLEHFDVNCSASHLRFRNRHSCAELVTTSRMVLDKRMEGNIATTMAQVEFARHAALLKSMLRRGVPMPLAMAYLREARRASITFVHCGWSTDNIKAGVDLHEGCSAASMLFRWVLQDCMEVLHTQWEASGLGIQLFSKVFTHLA